MRYSPEPKHDVVDVAVSRELTHAPLFKRIERDLPSEDRVCMLLLAGGADRDHALLRQTQSHLRFDALSSYWSHAALVADWTGKSADAVGLEVTHEPEAPARHTPLRNGVTPFKLARYADARRYPNLGFVSLSFKENSARYEGGRGARAEILEAALDPNRDRARYPLWRLLGPWIAYFHDPAGESPLARGVSMPSAAFCQYVFEAAGVNLMPSATTPGACPEHLWTAALRWSRGMDVELRIWCSIAKTVDAEFDAGEGSLARALPGLAALRDAQRAKK